MSSKTALCDGRTEFNSTNNPRLSAMAAQCWRQEVEAVSPATSGQWREVKWGRQEPAPVTLVSVGVTM